MCWNLLPVPTCTLWNFYRIFKNKNKPFNRTLRATARIQRELSLKATSYCYETASLFHFVTEVITFPRAALEHTWRVARMWRTRALLACYHLAIKFHQSDSLCQLRDNWNVCSFPSQLFSEVFDSRFDSLLRYFFRAVRKL